MKQCADLLDYRQRAESVVEMLGRMANINVSDDCVDKLCIYRDAVLAWNGKTQLVSRNDVGYFFSRHIGECLSLAAVYDLSVENIVDVGSGAGLPGIPLAILFPETRFLLVESMLRRSVFLKHAKSILKLKNVHVQGCRIEDVPVAYHGNADIVVSRAVASLHKLWSLCGDVLSQKGQLLAMKGGDLAPEVAKLLENSFGLGVEFLKYPAELVENEKDKQVVRVYRK